MTDYTKRMIDNCRKELRKAEAERNSILVAYWTGRIEALEAENK